MEILPLVFRKTRSISDLFFIRLIKQQKQMENNYNLKEDLNKMNKVISSCETKNHFRVCLNYITLLINKYKNKIPESDFIELRIITDKAILSIYEED